MKKILYLLPAVSFLFASCVEDEGNYTYNPVNEITVNGVEEIYSVLSKIDEIDIKPEITGTLAGTNTDQYEYTWYACSGSLGVEEQGIGPHEHTVLGHEKDLHCKIDLAPHTYALYLSIKDKTTDLAWSFSTTLQVSTSVTRGFLILGETAEGKVGLDMLAMPPERDTTIIENVFDNTELQLTQPEKLLFAGSYMAGDWKQTLWMMTGEGSYRMTNGSYFDIISEVNDDGMIEMEFDYQKPMHIKDMFPHQSTRNLSTMHRGYITEDLVVKAMVIQAEYFGTPANRYSATSSELFKPYPLAFYQGASSSASSNITVYDMDADRFVQLGGGFLTATHSLKLKDNESDPFPWDQKGTGRKIVYGENGFESYRGNSYAIMKDAESKFFIYRFSVASANPTKLGCYEIDPTVATDFDKASFYAFSSNRTAVMYTVGPMLYVYDYARKQLASKNLGADVTYLETEYSSRGSVSDFFVATHDGSKGVIRKLQVGSNPDVLELIDKPREVWETRLKVKDMEWKFAN